MDQVSQRDLKILTEISERQDITQRGLSKSLGLTHLYLKGLARKGYIKITTIPPNRLKYLLTPQGLSEKSRLTYTVGRGSVWERRGRHEPAGCPLSVSDGAAARPETKGG